MRPVFSSQWASVAPVTINPPPAVQGNPADRLALRDQGLDVAVGAAPEHSAVTDVAEVEPVSDRRFAVPRAVHSQSPKSRIACADPLSFCPRPVERIIRLYPRV